MAILLKYEEFKSYVSDILQDTQVIEEDLRWIYAYLHKGKTDKNYEKSKKIDVAKLVNNVEALDFAHENHQLNLDDYAVLRQIRNLRNYLADKIYSTFIFNQDYLKSLEYKNACEKVVNYYEDIHNLVPTVHKFKLYVIDWIGEIDRKAKQ